MKKKLLIFFLLIIVGGGAFAYLKYRAFVAPNVPKNLENPYVQIPSNSTFNDVVALLYDSQMIMDTASFSEVAHQLSYVKNPMRAGRYKVQPNWSNLKLVRHLRGGKQEAVKVILTNARLVDEVAGKASVNIEADSVQVTQLWQDEAYLSEIGYTSQTLMSLFIPNTYNLYWNTDAKGLTERLIKEHDNFWSKNDRKEKAKALDLSPAEVYTLASIVEKETNYKLERPRMAGVYLNRLRIGMLLQADPTAVFARKDFSTPRVTNYHTEFDSPYNTYMYTGLPPGPIAMASISSIDAVLNPETHKYLYFCAIGDGTGKHNFAKTLTQHNQNAAVYRANLRQRGRR